MQANQQVALALHPVPRPTLIISSQLISVLVEQRARGPVYVEWSNEIWNSAFPQWKQAMAPAAADKSLAYDGTGDPKHPSLSLDGPAGGECRQSRDGRLRRERHPQMPDPADPCGTMGQSRRAEYALDYIAKQVGPPDQYIYGIAIVPYATLSGNMWGRIQAGDVTVTEKDIVIRLQVQRH